MGTILTRHEDEKFKESYKQLTDQYFNSTNCKMYFNGILIDEGYDLIWQYRELKEPVYGYNSKYFDSILPGTVIISGAFSINYKYDKYLYKVLQASKADSTLGSQSKLKRAMETKSKNDNQRLEYKDTLKMLYLKQEQLKQLKVFDDKNKEELKNVALRKAQLQKIKEEEEVWSKNLIQSYVNPSNSDMIGEYGYKTKAKDFFEVLSQYDSETKEEKGEIINSNEILREIEVSIEAVELNQEEIRNELDILNNRKFYIISEVDKLPLPSNDTAILTKNNLYLKEIDKLSRDIQIKEEELVSNIVLLEQLEDDRDSAFTNMQNNIDESSGMIRLLSLEREEFLKTKFEDDPIFAQIMQTEIRLKDLEQKIKNIENDETRLMSTKEEDPKIQINKDIIALQDSLRRSKNSFDLANTDLVNLIKESREDASVFSKNRAEDFDINFDIMIYYENNLHKILKTATLTGHTHVIGQGGEPIREQYTFIARYEEGV